MTRQMLTPGIGHWGLGLEIGGTDSNPYFSHGGANEGFRNIFVAYEKSGDGAVVMTNSDAGSELGDEVMHSIADEYGWPDYRSTIRIAAQVIARFWLNTPELSSFGKDSIWWLRWRVAS